MEQFIPTIAADWRLLFKPEAFGRRGDHVDKFGDCFPHCFSS
jgi:hypothetical protein